MWLIVISECGFEISAIQPGVGVGADGRGIMESGIDTYNPYP